MSRRKIKHFKDFSEFKSTQDNKVSENEDGHWKQVQEALVLSQMIRAKTPNQEKLINYILTSVVTFVVGPAGVGKTHVTCGIAAKLLVEDKIDKIIITRPQVEVGGLSMGFLPGSFEEKAMPYVMPMIDSFKDFLGSKSVDKLMKDKIISILPLGLIRGHSPKGTFIIADECQSARYIELKALLTRIDLNSRAVLIGDPDQSDLQNGSKDFIEIMRRLKDLKDEIGFVKLGIEDCQRAGIVKKILERL